MRLNVYSSSPGSTQLAVAFQGLGTQVVLRPLSERPTAPAKPCRQRASLRAELADIREEMTAIGLVLDEHMLGCRRLSAGDENGLTAKYDALTSRARAIERTLHQLEKGGQPRG